jgi:hypothetical protein
MVRKPPTLTAPGLMQRFPAMRNAHLASAYTFGQFADP